MAAKKKRLPFDDRGGVIAQRRQMIDSPAYRNLSAQPKVLMTLMQCHWRNEAAVGYSIREAEAKIPCARGTAAAAFKALQENGFIVMVEESLFNSRTKSKSRTWRLTWLPFRDERPTNDWEKNSSTGSNLYLVKNAQGQKRTL